jgi:FlaG/FlaF family flagellin (archaellin)
MVAITVVLAGILYTMVIGLVKAPRYLPANVVFYSTTSAASSSTYIIENVSIMTISAPIHIQDVGFSVVNAQGIPFPNPTGGGYFIVNYFNTTGKYMGQYNIGGVDTAGPGTWQYSGCPVTLPVDKPSVCFSTAPDGMTTLQAGGWLTIVWFSNTQSPPQSNFYGYSLQVHPISGLTSMSGAIDLQ